MNQIDTPTEAQLKKFWIWCGFKPVTHAEQYPNISTNHPEDIVAWNYPDGDGNYRLPDIDLNNLFKYAVPKLRNKWQLHIDYGITFYDVILTECTQNKIHRAINTCDTNLTLALFWAIYQLIENSEK